MSEQTGSLKRIFILSGALCVYLIGAATATGQESMQFFSSHGYLGIASILITLLLFGWAAASLIALGSESKMENQSVYKFYFGNVVGGIFEWFVTLFLFGLVVTLLSGAGTIFTEFYGVPKMVGATLMAVLVYVTVLLSLNKLVDLLGFLAPIIIIFTTVISIVSIVKNMDGLLQASQILQEVEVVRAVDPWWLSGALYAAFGITVAAPFLIRMGSTAVNRKEAILGGLSGATIYAVAISIISLAVLANIRTVYDKEAPLVYLAEGFHPLFGITFSIIILAGIYTTGAPMFWYVSERFSVKDGKKKKVMPLLLIILAYFGGLFLPFGTLIGTVFPITGILGVFLFIAIAFHQIKRKVKKSVTSEPENNIASS